MTRSSFPVRIETDRLIFERLGHDTVDLEELVATFTSEEWQGETTEHMPWFRFEGADGIEAFIDHAEQTWDGREQARYILRSKELDHAEAAASMETNPIVGTAAFDPNWEKRCGGSDIVLAKPYWGRGYGTERASVFVELTFEHYDLEAYVTSCAVANEPSRRMIEKVIETYGGCYEGILRQFGAPHPDGTVTDQRRFSIVREEYEQATADFDTLAFEIDW